MNPKKFFFAVICAASASFATAQTEVDQPIFTYVVGQVNVQDVIVTEVTEATFSATNDQILEAYKADAVLVDRMDAIQVLRFQTRAEAEADRTTLLSKYGTKGVHVMAPNKGTK